MRLIKNERRNAEVDDEGEMEDGKEWLAEIGERRMDEECGETKFWKLKMEGKCK